jgi:hypothetical protein
MKKQMELFEPVTRGFADGGFEDGGLLDEGGSTDPVSGNDVPIGSTQEEVRDDIPAQLSEGEFVFPADVVRYFGLERLMQMRQEAKQGLKVMEAMGQMGNSDEATIPDDLPFNIDDLDMEDDGVVEYAQGGVVKAQQGTYVMQPTQQGVYQSQYQQQPSIPTPPVVQPPVQPVTPTPPPVQPVTPTPPPTQAPVRGDATFESLMGGIADPAAGGYDELITYVNDAGMELQIPFKDGKPIYPIPEGYSKKSDKVETAQTTTTTGTGTDTAQVGSVTGGDDDGDMPQYSTTDVSGIGYDRSKIQNEDLLSAINKSMSAMGKDIMSKGIPGQIALSTGLMGGIKPDNAILGGVIDQFRDPKGSVSFATGRKSGQYENTTELHNLTNMQQQQIADMFSFVSDQMDTMYTKTNDKGEKVGKTEKEITDSLRARASVLDIDLKSGNKDKRNMTLAREIAREEAKRYQDELAKDTAQARQEAKAALAGLPKGYQFDTKGMTAQQIKNKVIEQRDQQKRDEQTEAERRAREKSQYSSSIYSDDNESGQVGGGGVSSGVREAVAEAGGYTGGGKYGGFAKGGLAKQMKQSGLASKK